MNHQQAREVYQEVNHHPVRCAPELTKTPEPSYFILVGLLLIGALTMKIRRSA